MFAALRECNVPFYEDPPGTYTDNLGYCSPCGPGERWSNTASTCVLDTNIDVTPKPATDWSKLALYGLGLLLLVGAFAGGRASSGGGRRSSSPRLLSRTTTRSIFG